MGSRLSIILASSVRIISYLVLVCSFSTVLIGSRPSIRYSRRHPCAADVAFRFLRLEFVPSVPQSRNRQTC